MPARKTVKPAAKTDRTHVPAPERVVQAARQITGEDAAERAKAAGILADWASLLEKDEYAVTGSATAGVRIDVMKAVPAPIRDFVERSYDAYHHPLTHDGYELAANTAKYQHKTFADSTTAAEFRRLAQYYAKYRPEGRITVRATPLANDDTTIRIAAVPFEARPRK